MRKNPRLFIPLSFALLLVLLMSLAPAAAQDPEPDQPNSPTCGTFSPANEANSNPAIVLTFLHGSPSAHFDTPYLIGCQPAGFEAESARQRQSIGYNENGFVVSSTWDFIDFTVMAEVSYYPDTGLVAQAVYTCPLNPGTEAYGFRYDAQGRLEIQTHAQTRGCHDINAQALNRVLQYEYADGAFSDLPSSITDLISNETTTYSYQADDAGRVVEVSITYPDGSSETRRYTYDAIGQVSALEITTPTPERLSYSFTYDAAGRLLGRLEAPSGREWRISYDDAQDGRIANLITPNPVADEPLNILHDVLYSGEVE